MQHWQLWQPARRAYHHSQQTTALWDSNQHGNCHTQRRTHGRRVSTASKRWHMGPQQYGICGAQRHPSRYPQCTGAPELRASQHSRRNRQCGTAMASIRGAQRHPSGHPQCTKAPKRGRVSTAGAIGNVGPQQQASAAHRGTQAGICGAQGTQAGIRSAQGTQAGASQHSRRNRHVGPQTASIRGAHRHPSGHPQCTRHPSGGESPQPAQSVWDRNSSGICSADGSQRGWHIRMAGQGGNCWMACGDHDCGAICIWQGCQV